MSVEAPSRPAPPGRPRLSVVIMAYDRRDYLRAAVRSCREQDLAQSDFEIVVIKNFADPELDAELTASGTRLVLDTSPNVGATVGRALREARGEVVCFLDDDDEFEPTKLAAVDRLFAEDPRLVLLRNSYRAIDVKGRPLPDWPVCEWPAAPVKRPVTLGTEREKRSSTVLPMYNLSTISVRRSALVGRAEEYRGIAAGSDSLVFLTALASDGRVRVDPQVWTRHRIHRSVTMEWVEQGGVTPPASPEFLERSLTALRQQRTLVEGTAAEAWAQWLYVITRFDAFLAREEFPAPTVEEFVSFSRGAFRERQPFRAWALVFAALGRLSPVWARRQWWSFREHRQRAQTPGLDYAILFSGAQDQP